MSAVGYIRVSTEGQNGADSFGLETQRDAITKYCASNGIELIQVYEDPAFSGSLPPSLMQALEGYEKIGFFFLNQNLK